MDWRKAPTGWVSADGKWRIRGPIMGKRVYWLYHVGGGRHLLNTNDYESAVQFRSVAAAKRYVEVTA